MDPSQLTLLAQDSGTATCEMGSGLCSWLGEWSLNSVVGDLVLTQGLPPVFQGYWNHRGGVEAPAVESDR